jgi:hypothetical protein
VVVKWLAAGLFMLCVFRQTQRSGLASRQINSPPRSVLNQNLTVAYEGKDYEASFSDASGFVEVEVSRGDDFQRKMKRQMASGDTARIARMMALKILRCAKERGELG